MRQECKAERAMYDGLPAYGLIVNDLHVVSAYTVSLSSVRGIIHCRWDMILCQRVKYGIPDFL